MNPCLIVAVAICLHAIVTLWLITHATHYLLKQLHEIKEIIAGIRKRMN